MNNDYCRDGNWVIEKGAQKPHGRELNGEAAPLLSATTDPSLKHIDGIEMKVTGELKGG